jgi:hypothetical protein
MFAYDSADEWGGTLRGHLQGVLPVNIQSIVASAKPEYIQDALKVVLAAASDRAAVIALTGAWIKSQQVAAYHGPRAGSAYFLGCSRASRTFKAS